MAGSSPDINITAASSLQSSNVIQPESNVTPDTGPECSETEWEYEYDDNETETFFVSVELTPGLPVPNAKPPRKPKDLGSIHDADEQSADDGDVPLEEGGQNCVEERHEFEEDIPNRVQILDLHSPDPLISFQNRIYHCEWASSVSSSLFFTAHDPSNTSVPMVRSTPHYDLIGVSCTRITSSAAHLAPKNIGRPTRDNLFITEGPSHQQPQDKNIVMTSAADMLAPIQLNPLVDASRKAQASFLERLSTIKRAAGEQDEVTVIAKKVLHGTGWRYQRRNKLQMLEDKAEEGDELAAKVLADMYMPSRRPEAVGRPETGLGSRGGRVKTRYARGRPGRPRASGMTTLFDHMFAEGSTEGGIPEVLGHTPESWDELEARSYSKKPSKASRSPKAARPLEGTARVVAGHQGESARSGEANVSPLEKHNLPAVPVRSADGTGDIDMPDASG
ncbi:hypothetical protein GP486_001130 [Trichoglossum hirsutum]|uniref:Transcription factor TFIIIC triple barrel domain-containing protein n=1 Tax=Trichoglossum hirsutum TaxID=265104 RepID=A0A9P8RSX0_9PEZI|nr:hypothetical protein GP486_001130 [Trichoglossum hirsutum]